MYTYGLLAVVLNTCLQLSGAQGFHVQIGTSIECGPCGPDSPPGCRSLDCSVPVGQQVQVTCTFVGACDPLSHPLRMLRPTSEGIDEITSDDVRGIMPGFVSLVRPTDCSLRLTFTATMAANGVVLQCGVSTNEVMEFSQARVLAVRAAASVTADLPSATNLPQPTPSPTVTPPPTTSFPEEITSSPVTSPSSASSAGAQGYHVQIGTSIECGSCGPDSPPGCRSRDCSVPVGEQVQVTCTFVGECDPLSHPLRMLRPTSEGIDEITSDDVRGIMPGFVSLVRPTDCSLRLTFTATMAANGVVLQCGVNTNEVMEYSQARVLAVRAAASVTADLPSATNLPQPTPSPTVTPPPTTSFPEEIISSPVTSPSSASSAGTPSSDSPVVVETECVCSAPTSLPNGARTNSLSTWHTLSLTLLSLLLTTVLPLCL